LHQLIEISRKYASLKSEYSKEEISYFKNNNGDNLVREIQNGNLPKFKQIQKEYEAIEIKFIQIAKQFGKENNLLNRELIIQITEEILSSNLQSINQFLLINLMWEVGNETGSFCIDTLEKWIRKILSSGKIGFQKEYYLESLIDIWTYDIDKLIPIDILEEIILLELPIEVQGHGALIKATSYLKSHPKNEIEKVLAKARKTKSYKEDESYRDWID